jgi:hypothetical protein
MLGRATERLTSLGFTAADAALRAPAVLGAVVRQQASILGFLDCFWILGALAMLGPVLSLCIRPFDQRGTAGGGGH